MALSAKLSEEAVSPHRRPSDVDEAAALQHDERWLLVHRILESPGFQRADQLRKILLYISRRAILLPSDSIREYEIACDVLGRRQDFDPGSDTIVRVQISHLRRKLDLYFTQEGAHEPLRLSIPRGSYAASFEPIHTEPHLPAASVIAVVVEPAQPEIKQPAPPLPALPAAPVKRFRNVPSWLWLVMACLCTSLLTATLDFALRGRPAADAQGAPSGQAANAFLGPLLANHKDISVVLPDTSVMIIQTLLGQDVSAATYVNGSSQTDIKGVKDAGLREALSYVADRRNTSFNEAAAAIQLADRLSRAGAAWNLRYARDLHVSDLGGNNVILLGSRRSNPWATLFADKLNFQLLPDPHTHEFTFVNAHPLPGEPVDFAPDYQHDDAVVIYADIALVPNLNNTGSVLLISGSDVQGTEAAVRFMLEGDWPPQLKALFSGKDIKSYEVFLRGTHIKNEAPDHFDVIAIRSHA